MSFKASVYPIQSSQQGLGIELGDYAVILHAPEAVAGRVVIDRRSVEYLLDFLIPFVEGGRARVGGKAKKRRRNA